MAIAGLYKIFDHWHQQGTVHIISDTHFGDEELRAGFPDRPTDEDIVKSINAKVGRKDTLIILGDIGDIECVKKLRGYKVLIMGNHDAGKSNYTGVFNEVYEGALMVGEKLILSHEPVELPWAFNIHGHDHAGCQRPFHLNVCSDVIGYKPVNLNQFLKSGALSRIQTIHRSTIDRATQRKKKRGKKIGK